VTKTFLASAQSYWAATGAAGELPELPDAPLDALIEVVDRASGAEGAFELLDVSRDPYPGLAVGDLAEPWRLLWAIQLAQLDAFISPDLPGITFFVDTIADPSGSHRVYGHADRPEDALEFANIADAIAWMAGQARFARGQIDAAALGKITAAHTTQLVDDWEEGPTSGRFVLEALLELPFAEAWDALSRGEWPVLDTLRKPFRDKGKVGWQRSFSLWLIERFLETRVITLPAGVKASALDAAHRELVRQLASLEEALHTGLVPELIEQLAAKEGDRLAPLAREWIERYEAWRELSEPPPPLDEEDEPAFDAAKLAAAILGKKIKGDGGATTKGKAKGKAKKAASPDEDDAFEADALPDSEPEAIDTPFTRKLRVVITESLEDMVRREILEVEPEQKAPLLSELVEAAADSRSAQHMLKQLTRTLVNSDNVEEIYASDDEVTELFRAHMGG
jgi:hypothetical protein